MIRGNVEQHRDVRTERRNRFELKTAGFDDSEAGIARNIDARDQRCSDVSRNLYGKSRGFEDVANERRGCGLAVRAGDAYQATPQESRSQLDFTPYRYPDGARGSKRRQDERHARTRHNQILLEKSLRLVAAQLEPNTCGAQLRGRFRDLRFR